MSHRSIIRLFARGVMSVTLVSMTACLRDKSHEGAAGGAVDTASPAGAAAAITPATGLGVQVTRTDSESILLATQYELTKENFTKFLAAAESLSVLAMRDSSVRNHLRQPIAGADANELDAGLKWLESNPAVNNAIVGSGLSAHDYFVMAIAIASAEQTKPSATPPTPVARANAKFLRKKPRELARLHSLQRGTPGPVER
jgi:hypothetical protein